MVGGSKLFDLLERAVTVPPREDEVEGILSMDSIDEEALVAKDDEELRGQLKPSSIQTIAFDSNTSDSVQLVLERWVDSPAFTPMVRNSLDLFFLYSYHQCVL